MPLRCLIVSMVSLAVVVGAEQAQEKAVPADLVKKLKDEDPDVRISAIKGLSKLGTEAVPMLVQALRDLSESEVDELAVVDHGDLVGVLTRNDVMRFIQVRNDLDGGGRR